MGLLSTRMSSANSVAEIDVNELARLRAEAEASGKPVLVIDVREPDEYHDGHVPGALLVPLATVPGKIDAFVGDGEQPVYIVCKSGGRSMQAAEFVADHGAQPVNIAGGTMGWIDAGHAVVTGSEPV